MVALLFNRNGFLAISRLMNERGTVSVEIDSLTELIDSLHLEIEMLQTDTTTMERVVREVLGWGRPGEVIIRFVPPEGMEDSL